MKPVIEAGYDNGQVYAKVLSSGSPHQLNTGHIADLLGAIIRATASSMQTSCSLPKSEREQIEAQLLELVIANVSEGKDGDLTKL